MFNRRNIILAVLVFSFIFSLIFFLNNKSRYTRVSFQFYHELTDQIVTEDRFILLEGDRDQRAKKMVKELFLGPMSVFNRKLTNYNLEYNNFIIRDGVAYLDLPIEFVLDFDDSKHTIEETASLLEKNILRNINKINSVVLTVDGYLLNNGPYPDQLPQVTGENKK